MEETQLKVGVVREASRVLDEAFESEAKLDANRRSNEAIRGYQEGLQHLTQNYHSDPDSSPEQYATDIDNLRERTFNNASSGAGGRAQKYLRPELDNMKTRIRPEEMRLIQGAVESKQLMHIQDQFKAGREAITMNASGVYDEIDAYAEQVNASSLDADKKREMIDNAKVSLSDQAIAGFGREKNLTGLNAFLESDIFNSLTLDQQEGVRKDVRTLSTEILTDNMEEHRIALMAGEVSIEQAMRQVTDDQERMPGYTEAQQAQLNDELLTQVTGDYFVGLINRKEFNTALTELKNPKLREHLDPDQYAKFLKAATDVKAATSNMFLTELGNNVASEIGRLGAGLPANPDIRTEVAAAAASAATESEKYRVAQMQGQLDIWEEPSQEIAAAPTMTNDQLMDLTDTAQERTKEYAGDNWKVQATADNLVIDTASRHLAARSKDSNTYAANFDENTKASWEKFKTTTDAMFADPNDETTSAAAVQYQLLRKDISTAVVGYGFSEPVAGVPADPEFVTRLTSLLDSDMRADQTAGVELIRRVFGDDAMDIANQMSGSDPVISSALAFGLYNRPNEQNVMIRGRQRVEQYGDNIKFKPTHVTDPDKNGNVVIPMDAVGNYGQVALSAMYTYAVGIASDAELQSGDMADETMQRSRDAVFGPPFKVNEYADNTLPWRDPETGEMVENAGARFKALKLGAPYEGKTPTFADGTTVSVVELLEVATPVLVGPGQYKFDIRYTTAGVPAGYVLDDDGDELIIDMTGVPAEYSLTRVPSSVISGEFGR
jgi:hypothetical protein